MVENTGRKVTASLSIGSYIKKGESGKVLKYYPTHNTAPAKKGFFSFLRKKRS